MKSTATKAPSPSFVTPQRVLEQEAQALIHLSNNLDDHFTQAIELIKQRQITGGRVIVSGMGKSGHIGAKIAATLASTGTPAFFVHPGEASHGDLGMITEKDTVLALSHSGEAKELGDIIAYTNRFNIPLLALTGCPNSSLAKAATLILNTHVTEEACPLKKAPTTSALVTLAFGHALAITLMEEKGFAVEDYAILHPGGKLGAQMKTVADLMAKGDELPLIGHNDTMDSAIVEMTQKNLGCVGVTDDSGALVGIITDGDLKRLMQADFLSQKAQEVMAKNPLTLSPDMPAVQALHHMQHNKKNRQVTAFFIVNEDSTPLGLLHIHHCLAAGVI